jgi:phage-related protein (TIGR01555 family)
MKTLKTELKNSQRKLKSLRNDILELRNSLGDLLPSQADNTEQLSSLETLYRNQRYTPLTINRILISYLYCEHGIIQTAIDQPVLDAFRGGVDIQSPELDNDDIQELQDLMKQVKVIPTAQQAAIWKRLFGGSGIIINVDVDPTRPFDAKATNELEFYCADRWELNGQSRFVEKFNFYGVEIHSSRVITLVGKEPPSIIRPQLLGWGMSEVERMVRDLNAYLKNKNLVFELLDEAKVDVFHIDGFNNALATATGTEKIRRRVELAAQIKNYQNALVMDTKDTYDQKTLTFSGLPEMIKETRIGIACALKIPLTKLFGLSAAGFNSGEDDIENYNSMVESDIRTPMEPVLKTMISLCCMKLFGHIPQFNIKYKPLRMMSELDEENINKIRHDRMMDLYREGIINSEELAQALQHYKLIPIETQAEQGLLPDQPEKPGAMQLGIPGQPGQEGQDPDKGKENKETKE